METSIIECSVSGRDKHIASIYISAIPKKDTIMWKGERNGKYSVKSGYILVVNLASQAKPQISTAEYCERKNHMFRKLWKLKIPPKLQFFCWRLMHNICATMVALFRRSVVFSPMCKMWHCIRHECFYTIFLHQHAPQDLHVRS